LMKKNQRKELLLKRREMQKVYNYVFHYNPHTETWNAIPRDKYQEYWSNKGVKEVLKSKELKVLTELINKGEEFIKSIK